MKLSEVAWSASALVIFSGLGFGLSQSVFPNNPLLNLGISATIGGLYLFFYKFSNIIEASIVMVVLLILLGVALPLFKH